MSSRIDLTGRTIVITGAASGMGRSLAQLFSRRGNPVAVCDQNEEGLAETVAGLDGPVLHHKLDVRDRQGMFAFAAEVDAWSPTPLGVIFNNAGVTVAQTLADSSPEDDEWVFDINFGGVMHGTRAFLPILLGQGDGVIANTSSIFGFIGYPAQSAYCASKHAVKGFTESLRNELRGTNVRAVTIHPGGIKTNIVRNARWRSDHRGHTDRREMVDIFDRITITSADKAAEIIVGSIERGRSRILVGPDAYAIDLLARVAPVRWYGVIARLEPLAERLAGRS